MYCVIPGESLTDPLILNRLHVIGLDVIQAPSSSKFPYWYEFVVEADNQTTSMMQAHIKPGWFCAKFTETDVSIIFPEKIFDVIMDGKLTTEAEIATRYGVTHNVQHEFLDWRERQRVYLSKLSQAKGK